MEPGWIKMSWSVTPFIYPPCSVKYLTLVYTVSVRQVIHYDPLQVRVGWVLRRISTSAYNHLAQSHLYLSTHEARRLPGV
jgi:hypothetical protein